ncbi:FxSxx-COOH system tetratricopeptide repeat protein [Micromonospora sp. WMMD975]|uniref:FxSxx-COOH system tetratricopeptide repeat protein n=1 Tax=Micromonospora sp. WMMD975 TaxID=3016087 RepID=UPI00249AF3A2|nr:FxSxx-COOH system tetratricopeptide repeat protein [Micromonospora sp. WMMD975]WFE33181.1 FxSxx-COOH system tetratricopeptide repeat protein [Micromonospora sp. WMMD975]
MAEAKTARVDLFVSYAGPDRPWAEWAARQLETAGYTVELDVWDWATGANFVLCINDALARADRVLALFSVAYFERERFTIDEWTAVLAERPDETERRRLIPVRVQEVKPPPILRSLIYRDLFDLAEPQARAALLAAVGGPVRPATAPFPGDAVTASTARVPGSYPAVWNAPRRNQAFTGRQGLLAALRAGLTGGDRAVVQALAGLGGVGKTQLAIEYAHLFVGDYDLVWWIDAERPELIGEQVAALAVAAGWVDQGVTIAVAQDIAWRRLRAVHGWLLIFDNATDGTDLARWLPPETGHVIVTSRSSAFAGVATPVEVDVFSRAESVDMLRQHLPTVADADADRLAAQLGDLPLALAQATGLMAETRIGVADYLTELTEHTAQLLRMGAVVGYPAPLAAAIEVSLTQLTGEEDSAGVQFLQLCAQLAPEPIPLRWFADALEGILPEPLATVAGARLAFRNTLARLARLGLVRLDEHTVQLHRLTQAVLRDLATPAERQDHRQRAEQIVAAGEPDNDGTDPLSWPAWAELLPHLLTLDAATAGTDLRDTACNAAWYLLMRADYRTVLPLAERWHRQWRSRLHPDDGHVLWMASQVATAYWLTGRYEQARQLHEDTLHRYRRTFGDDHPNTLTSANNLAGCLIDLGEHEQGRQLHEDTLHRRRQILGDDHPNTLTSANNFADSLARLGEHERARQLHEDTLHRYRRTLGDDHPNTLTSTNNLAASLSDLGEHEQARQLHEDTLHRRRRTLGDDHPDTLTSTNNLANSLARLGEHEQARQLREYLVDRRRARADNHPDTAE